MMFGKKESTNRFIDKEISEDARAGQIATIEWVVGEKGGGDSSTVFLIKEMQHGPDVMLFKMDDARTLSAKTTSRTGL